MAPEERSMKIPDRLYVGAPVHDGGAPVTDHIELGHEMIDLPDPKKMRAFAANRTLTLIGWHVLTHRRNDPRYKKMASPPPEHAAVGHFERSRWTDEAWEQLDGFARAVEAQAVVFQTPPTFKANTEHATRLENFVAHASRPGLALCWEWAKTSWPDGKALDLCERIGATPVLDPTQHAIPEEGEFVYLRFRGGASGRAQIKDDDLKKTALAVRDRIGWVIFSNATAARDAQRFAEMI
jgi:uncharacterized protein YecE (DUF72 family)